MNPTPSPTAPSSTEPTFSNPYEGCHKSNSEPTRFNVDVDQTEYEFIKLLRPTKGTVVISVNTLFHKLVLECKRRGITDITKKKDYEHFIAHCVIAMPSELNGTLEKQYATKPNSNGAATATPAATPATPISGSSTSGDMADLTRSTPTRSLSHPSERDVRGATPTTSSATPTTSPKQSDLSGGSKGVSRRTTRGK